MIRIRTLTLLLACCCALGCLRRSEVAPAPAAPQPMLPATVGEATTKLNELHATIKGAFDAGTPHECDAALHEAFDLVLALEDIATKEGLAEADVETAKQAGSQLSEAFMKIHEGFHSHDGAATDGNAYEGVAEGITGALQSLEGLGAG